MEPINNSGPPGLAPVAGKNPTVLVLGSFPSIISLGKNEYYGNPRNSFWRIVEELFGIDSNLPYDERTKELEEAGIALWDVISGCRRDGSSDSSIRDARPNDIPGFLEENPTIKCIALNGKSGAGRHFDKYFMELRERTGLAVFTMPSTSPANAIYSFEEKVAEWRQITAFTRKND